MIYGDNPQKINERQDAQGLTAYTYVPQISAIMQSGNLYVYAVNNPVLYCDPSGDIVISALGWLFIGAFVGAILGGGMNMIGQRINGTAWKDINWKSVAI